MKSLSLILRSARARIVVLTMVIAVLTWRMARGRIIKRDPVKKGRRSQKVVLEKGNEHNSVRVRRSDLLSQKIDANPEKITKSAVVVKKYLSTEDIVHTDRKDVDDIGETPAETLSSNDIRSPGPVRTPSPVVGLKIRPGRVSPTALFHADSSDSEGEDDDSGVVYF